MPPPNPVFIAFGGSSTDAARRRVRSQAALASAATRKATLARNRRAKKKKEKEKAEDFAYEAGEGEQRYELVVRNQRRNLAHEPVPQDQHYQRSQDTVWFPTQPSHNHGPQCKDATCRYCGPYQAEHHGSVETSMSMMRLSAAPDPYSIGGIKVDPFNSFPVDYHPIYDRLLHHMVTVTGPRSWKALKTTPDEGWYWGWYLGQLSLTEPALFLVRCLSTANDLFRLDSIDPDLCRHLRTLVIQAINDALSDPIRSTSDGLIVAVGRVAVNESLYGDREVASLVHRSAQRKMIDLRGGMRALPFPPLIKRLMRQMDSVMSLQTGTPRFLPDHEEQDNKIINIQDSMVLRGHLERR